MHRRTIPVSLLALALVAVLGGAALAAPPPASNFVATLSGDQEAEPVDTRARGVAQFKVNADGDLDFRLNVANITDVTMAHIHLGASNGPVVAWLHPAAPPAELLSGRVAGTIARGTITDADLVGPLAGGEIGDLLEQIRAGEAWVNVHTEQHPTGEIAGPISRPGGRAG